MSTYVVLCCEADSNWRRPLEDDDRVSVSLACDSCGTSITRECRVDQVDDQEDALRFRAWCLQWRVGKTLIAGQGPRDYCAGCYRKLTGGPGRDDAATAATACLGESKYRTIPRGFTLIELLAVLAIVGIIAVAALPVVLEATGRDAAGRAARLLQGELAAATARAQRDGVAGLRLVPDAAFPIKRLADGSVDPTAPLAYSRVVPLERPDAIQDGRVSIRSTFPAGFPALGTRALVLEQEVAYDEGGFRAPNEPTSWAWRVRLGDRVELAGKVYTVCGPVVEANPEGFVNYGPGLGTGLDRGDGWADWLLLVNGFDDDDDGWIDEGYNGLDDDTDGEVDEPDEWSTECESWRLNAPVVNSRYLIRPRPAPAADGLGLELAGAVIDATGWADASPSRSRLPVDRVSGYVDLTVHGDGRVEPVARYAPTVPAVGMLKRPYLHFWIADRGAAGDGTPGVGVIVTVSARTGRTLWGVGDPVDVAGSIRDAEGGQ